MDESLPRLTVICPVYNEEEALPPFFERLSKVFGQLRGRYETALYFIDNGSIDRSHNIIKKICAESPNVYTLVLSRNFGYQCAVECGLRNAPGDLLVVIDVDCEDPPEMILEFLKYYEEGYNIVYGERVDRPEGALIKACRKFFYRSVRAVADDNFVLDMAEFGLITGDVRDAIIRENNAFPFIRASIGRVGFKRKNIPYKRQKRMAGKSHYNFWRMFLFAVAGLLSSSTLLLRIPTYVFPFWFVVLVGLGAFGPSVLGPGWLPAVLILGFGFCGFTLTAISLYVARTYKNSFQRPNFILDRKQCILPNSLTAGWKT